MENGSRKLIMIFDGQEKDRRSFLNKIRAEVINFTRESMTLDVLVIEIAKNIFDHADGLGMLAIEETHGSFVFKIHDNGEQEFDFNFCWNNSRLSGNGTNFGAGLRVIVSVAKDLGIDLGIDTRKGFSYSGTYTPKKQ